MVKRRVKYGIRRVKYGIRRKDEKKIRRLVLYMLKLYDNSPNF